MWGRAVIGVDNVHSENANAVAKWLENHDLVDWVSHTSLPSHSMHERAKKYFRQGTFGAVLTFGPKGGFEAAKSFIDNVKKKFYFTLTSIHR